MFGSTILDVAIGLAFVYLILSLITTTVTELIATVLALRSRNLRRGVEALLNDLQHERVARQFYRHPLITSLSRPSWLAGLLRLPAGNPSYIPSPTFAAVLVDLILEQTSDGGFRPFDSVDTLREALRSDVVQLDAGLKRQLLIILDQVDTVEQAYASLEQWFNNAMDRVSGWYKRKAQLITLVIAFVVTFAINGDTTMLFNRLMGDATLREAVSAAAENYIRQPLPELEATPVPDATEPDADVPPEDDSADAQTNSDDGASPDLESALNRISELQRPIIDTFELIGWSSDPDDPRAVPDWDDATAVRAKLLGLILTAIMVSLGAPFWFDMLNRLVKIRATGPALETSAPQAAVETPASAPVRPPVTPSAVPPEGVPLSESGEEPVASPEGDETEPEDDGRG